MAVEWNEGHRGSLVELLKRDSLRVGQFTLASGRSSHYYIDGRKVTLGAEGARLIGRGVLKVLDDHPEIAAVGGLTMGADPIVGAALALAPDLGRPELRGFLVRKQAKGHGTGNLVEGPLEPGSTAVDAVEALGCKVAVVIAVLDRLEGAAANFAARGLAFRSLLTIRDLGVEPLPPA
ncbi:hypothetical protein HK102_010848 [Quaeritorhiza haematococci]|nr:hypothetical protein HK102_010848 [Quaeritorhiza haematococci]